MERTELSSEEERLFMEVVRDTMTENPEEAVEHNRDFRNDGQGE
jgi:hypothetical protein